MASEKNAPKEKSSVLVVSLLSLTVVVGVLSAMGWSWVETEYESSIALIDELGIDEYTSEKSTWSQRGQIVLMEHLSGAKKMGDGSETVTKLGWIPSEGFKDLRVTRKFDEEKYPGIKAINVDESPALVVGTIRMGFGHYRLAYAACSWAAGDKSRWPGGVYFHDLLSIDGPESALIGDSDKIYRASSKMATELGGPFEWLHGYLTTSGDAASLRTTALLAKRLVPLIHGLPKDAPLIAAHSLVALAGTLAGKKNVINLVIDNHPQWFILAPTTLNLFQGPRTFYEFAARRKMLDPQDLRLAGHWSPRDNVIHAIADADFRIAQRSMKPKPPLKVLLPVGGAGAQRKFLTGLIHGLADDIKAGSISIILNAGDHEDINDALLTSVHQAGFSSSQITHIDSYDQVVDLANTLSKSKSIAPITILFFHETFPAVTATDILARYIDILACKPSELAFFPVPKLMIRRVGDHEASSANRANELADGTAEIRSVEHAIDYLRLFADSIDMITTMNEAIKTNVQNGVYDGAKNAVAHASSSSWLSSSSF